MPYRANKKDDELGNPCSSLGVGDDHTAEVEVLMISTPNRTDMVFPKVRLRSYVQKPTAAATTTQMIDWALRLLYSNLVDLDRSNNY